MWLGEGFPKCPFADIVATGKETEPYSSIGTCAERGKPVALPKGTASCKANLWGSGYRIVEKANAAL